MVDSNAKLSTILMSGVQFLDILAEETERGVLLGVLLGVRLGVLLGALL